MLLPPRPLSVVDVVIVIVISVIAVVVKIRIDVVVVIAVVDSIGIKVLHIDILNDTLVVIVIAVITHAMVIFDSAAAIRAIAEPCAR